MKSLIKNFGKYLISFCAAMWCGVVAVIILQIPFNFISDSLLYERVFQGAALTIVPAIFIFVVMKKKGHKAAKADLRQTAICFGLCFLIQQLFSYFIGYAIYISGGSIHFALAIFLKNAEAIYDNSAVLPLLSATAKGVPIWSYHIFMLIIDCFIFMPAAILGENAGVKKRLAERAELNL